MQKSSSNKIHFGLEKKKDWTQFHLQTWAEKKGFSFKFSIALNRVLFFVSSLRRLLSLIERSPFSLQTTAKHNHRLSPSKSKSKSFLSRCRSRRLVVSSPFLGLHHFKTVVPLAVWSFMPFLLRWPVSASDLLFVRCSWSEGS